MYLHRMKRIFLLFASLAFLCNCTFILKKMYGIKDPRVENEKSIKKKALKFGLDTSNIVTVNAKDFSQTRREYRQVPDAAIFDSNGNYIEYRQTDTSCNAGLFGFIPALNITSNYNKPLKNSLTSELEKYRDLKGQKLKPVSKADFYILIYWVVYAGKLNKDHVKAWEDLAGENKNCTIKVIKVNLDYQQYWDEAERNEIMGKKK